VALRSDGRWHGRLSVGNRGGRRLRRSVYGSTRTETLRRLHELRRELERGQPITPPRLTVEQFLTRWLNDTVALAVRPATLVSYRGHCRNHLIPPFGTIPLSDLTPEQVQRLLNDKLAAGLAPRTVRQTLMVLRAALGHAVRRGLVARNPARVVTAPRIPDTKPAGITPNEAHRILAAVQVDRLGALYALGLGTGLRLGEALGLGWDDLDLAAGHLTVRRALQRVHGRLVLVEPKTRRSRRTIVLPATISAELRRHRVRQMEERLRAGTRWHETGLTFTSLVGTPLDAAAVTKRLKRLLVNAGLPPTTFHGLRHAAASLLLAQGVNPRMVMELLGHADIAMTLGTYSHLTAPVRNEAADRMDLALSARADVMSEGVGR